MLKGLDFVTILVGEKNFLSKPCRYLCSAFVVYLSSRFLGNCYLFHSCLFRVFHKRDTVDYYLYLSDHFVNYSSRDSGGC